MSVGKGPPAKATGHKQGWCPLLLLYFLIPLLPSCKSHLCLRCMSGLSNDEVWMSQALALMAFPILLSVWRCRVWIFSANSLVFLLFCDGSCYFIDKVRASKEEKSLFSQCSLLGQCSNIGVIAGFFEKFCCWNKWVTAWGSQLSLGILKIISMSAETNPLSKIFPSVNISSE